MMQRPSALVLALALHAALIALVVSGVLEKPQPRIEPPSLVIQLLTPTPVAPALPEPPRPEPPKPKPPKPEPPKPTPQRPEPPKPEPLPEKPAQVAPAPAPAPVAPPPPAPATPAAPAVPPAPAPAPAPPKPVARTEVSISASYAASNRKPEYPKMSQRLNEQGTVVLTVLVKSDGSAGDVEVKSSTGFQRLDRAAMDAVRSWHFNPATVDGKPVDKTYEVPITFKPQN
jgi:protein TonB